MNRYGLMAQQHWERWLPGRYAAIEDPDSFFSDLGNQAEARIGSLAAELAGNDQPGEGFLAKAGRLGEARHRAEQIVLPEDVLLAPEPGADQDAGEPAAGSGLGPGVADSGGPGGVAAGSFRPSSQDDLAPSGAVSRARANLAALTTLRTIQREARPATADEQQVLARWSGWGAVPEVFDAPADRSTPGHASSSAGLLSPQETGRRRPQHPERPLHRRRDRSGGLVCCAVARLHRRAGCWSLAAAAATSSGSPPTAAQITGVELDPVTAAIAAALHTPGADPRGVVRWHP